MKNPGNDHLQVKNKRPDLPEGKLIFCLVPPDNTEGIDPRNSKHSDYKVPGILPVDQ